MIDTSTLPINPVLLIAAAGYAAASALITGPEIIERELVRSGWQESCKASLTANIEATRRPDQVIPQVPDVGGMLCSVYPELRELCDLIPDPNIAAQETERRAREAAHARVEQAASQTASACSCAEAVYVDSERLSIALYAASGRWITPNSVENREIALTRALNSPACAFGKEG